MPTATSFSWLFPWEQMVGAFNAFINLLGLPVAIAVALILSILVATFVVSITTTAKQELPDGARIIYEDDTVVHYTYDGKLYERSKSDSSDHLVYETDPNHPRWLPHDSGWAEADSDAYYLHKHGDIPASMLVDEQDERWVY